MIFNLFHSCSFACLYSPVHVACQYSAKASLYVGESLKSSGQPGTVNIEFVTFIF